MTCEYCEIIAGKGNAEILHQDDDLVVAVRDYVLSPGQITVFPKEHHTIMEMVPDRIIKKCSLVANKVSTAIFESLGAQGTNVIVRNGTGAGQSVPHFSLEIVPRQENDGLNFQWPPQQFSEDEMEITATHLKQEADQIVWGDKKEETKAEVKELKEDPKNGENYLLKSLKRQP